MKIYSEISMENFHAWSGAIETLETIKRAGKCDELEALLEEIAPEDGWSDVGINDVLWFESSWLFDSLGISEDEDEDTDEENELDKLPPPPPEYSIL